jgi:hypothetical protein
MTIVAMACGWTKTWAPTAAPQQAEKPARSIRPSQEDRSRVAH